MAVQQRVMQVKVVGENPIDAIEAGAESVTLGHPDEMLDYTAAYILDSIITACQSLGKEPRFAVEFTAKAGIDGQHAENLALFKKRALEEILRHGLVTAQGEMTLPSELGEFPLIPLIIEGIKQAGYRDPNYSFYPTKDNILIAVSRQSEDIAAGVDTGGAGDQGFMVGFATNRTSEGIPLTLLVARKLTQRQTELFEANSLDGAIKPDGKAQVTIDFEKQNGLLVPKKISGLTVAVSHDPKLPLRQLREFLIEEQIKPVLDQVDLALPAEDRLIINGTGKPWVIYGPTADNGQNGRKLMVNAYGVCARHGGGADAPKDGTKVDNSGAKFARFVAKNIVTAGACTDVEVIVNYSIGVPTPHIITINHYGTLSWGWTEEKLQEFVMVHFNWTVPQMLKELQIFQPIHAKAIKEGVYGNNWAPWEQIRV